MKISKETLNILNEKGHNTLGEYLEYLADDFGLRIETVEVLAETLSENELFDGLVTACEDFDIYDGWSPHNGFEDNYD